jgi:hypothetical protein
MYPGQLPAGIGQLRGEDFRAARGVNDDNVIIQRFKGLPDSQGFAAADASAVARCKILFFLTNRGT